MKIFVRTCLHVVLATLAGCATLPDVAQRVEHADRLAGAHGWTRQTLETGRFRLAAWQPDVRTAGGTLRIYIEGDGLAWVSTRQPSRDPTPLNPMALRMALAEPGAAAAYLARPCQFVRQPSGCDSKWWTDARFAPEVVEAMDLAVSRLKQEWHADRIELIGYSGGGAVAALVAARRSDVFRLITVAGNLDHPSWTALHRATSLQRSLNPADAWLALQAIPQWHFVGADDSNMPPTIFAAYRARFADPSRLHLVVLHGFDHSCCWSKRWTELHELARGTPLMHEN